MNGRHICKLLQDDHDVGLDDGGQDGVQDDHDDGQGDGGQNGLDGVQDDHDGGMLISAS